jgi:hypothetical protein
MPNVEPEEEEGEFGQSILLYIKNNFNLPIIAALNHQTDVGTKHKLVLNCNIAYARDKADIIDPALKCQIILKGFN